MKVCIACNMTKLDASVLKLSYFFPSSLDALALLANAVPLHLCTSAENFRLFHDQARCIWYPNT
jgi:hypothetical protein